jgi:hypothetical protein
VIDTTAETEQLLATEAPVAACLAPSFPAEFDGLEHTRLVLTDTGNEIAFCSVGIQDRLVVRA